MTYGRIMEVGGKGMKMDAEHAELVKMLKIYSSVGVTFQLGKVPGSG